MISMHLNVNTFSDPSDPHDDEKFGKQDGLRSNLGNGFWTIFRKITSGRALYQHKL